MFEEWKKELKNFLKRKDLTEADFTEALVEVVSISAVIVGKRNKFLEDRKQAPMDPDTDIVLEVQEPAEEGPKRTFIRSEHCHSRLHCEACRTRQGFRDNIRRHYRVPDDFDRKCPLGIVVEDSDKSLTDNLPEPELPPVVEQAKNFTKAMGKAAKAAIKGEQVRVDKKTHDQRVSTCRQCMLFIQSKARCSHPQCGCYVDKKAWLATEECPEGFWSEPEKQKAFNEGKKIELRKMQRNVITVDDFIQHKEAILRCISKDALIRKAYVRQEKNASKCKSCAKGSFTKEFSKAFLKDWAQQTPEVQKRLREILGHKEYVMNENVPMSWDEIEKLGQE